MDTIGCFKMVEQDRVRHRRNFLLAGLRVQSIAKCCHDPGQYFRNENFLHHWRVLLPPVVECTLLIQLFRTAVACHGLMPEVEPRMCCCPIVS